MNILMISAPFPYPPTLGGTEVRTFHLLKYLCQRHNVTLATLRGQSTSDEDVAALGALLGGSGRLQVFPRPFQQDAGSSLLDKARRFGAFLVTGTPPHTRAWHVPAMQSWLDDFLAANRVDALTCEHSINEIYVRPEYRQRCRTYADVHSSVYWSRRHLVESGVSENRLRDWLSLPLLRRYERRYCSKFTALIVTTDDDREKLERIAADQPIYVVSNGVDLQSFTFRAKDPGGHRLIFTGAMDVQANIDAARFLALAVMPGLRERYPDAQLSIVGARPAPAVAELGSQPGLEVTGGVDSMCRHLHRATVCVLPLRTGLGIKNKTLEAMAAGTPVVGSRCALEGLPVDESGQSPAALRAEEAGEIIEAVSRLFETPGLRQQTSKAARTLVERGYSWEQAGRAYEKVLASARTAHR